MKSIPRPNEIAEKEFEETATQLFLRIMQLADNAGATDKHRAINYLALRYPEIYAATTRAHGRGESLASVEVNPSRLSGVRTVLDVVFSFVNRTTDMANKWFVRVDVTEKFPFLVTKLSPFYDRV